MNDFFDPSIRVYSEIVPSDEVDYEVGQSIWDAAIGRFGVIEGINSDDSLGLMVRWATSDKNRYYVRKKHMHWVGSHWICVPRPWKIHVGEWDSETFIAQSHELQSETMLSGSSVEEAIFRIKGQGMFSIFKLHRVDLRLDPIALLRGLEWDLSSNGPFSSALDLEISPVTLAQTMKDSVMVNLAKELDKAWDKGAPDGIWWVAGGSGEVWCSNCIKPQMRCSCGE